MIDLVGSFKSAIARFEQACSALSPSVSGAAASAIADFEVTALRSHSTQSLVCSASVHAQVLIPGRQFASESPNCSIGAYSLYM